jgi:hypothetical protein
MSRSTRAGFGLRTAFLTGLGLGLVAMSGSACDGSAESTEPSGATVAAAETPAGSAAKKEAVAEEGAATKKAEPTTANPPQQPSPSRDAAGESDETGAGDKTAPEAAGETTGGDSKGEGSGEIEAAAPPEEGEASDKVAPEEVVKVLMLGDSLAATGFGAMVEKGLDAHPQVTCYRKGKSSSGLARPDFFNWADEARRQLDFRKPDLVVVIMGGNDGQDLTTKSGKGKRVHWKTHEWKIAYRKRMDDFLAQIGANDRQIVWLGLPQAGMRSFEKKLVTIREIQKAAVDALGDKATYLDTTPFLVDEDGKLNEFGRVRGKKRKIRAEDRIHFTMSGSQFLANHVVPEILNQIGLSPVEG